MTATTVSQTAPEIAVNDIGSQEDLLAAIDATIKDFNDGDIVEGHIVKVDRDEVLLDIGYKTEGVIPSRELSIKHDVDPNEVVSVGDEVEALVLQKLLTKRFGTLPRALVIAISAASATQIDVWVDRVLDAASLEDVFRP